MKPSPSLKTTLKRFAWLWGAVLGAVLFPALMALCHYYMGGLFIPAPKGPLLVPLNSHVLLKSLLHLTGTYWKWGAGVGGCAGLLWMGHRSLWWRLLSIGVGVATTIRLALIYRDYWRLTDWGDEWGRWYHSSFAATLSPLVLAALLLVFFALLLRSPCTSATKA